MPVTEPILKKGNLCMRGQDVKIRDLVKTAEEGRRWDSIHLCLEWAYRINDSSRFPRPIVLGTLPGGEGGEGLMALSIVNRIHKVLGFDHLIAAIHVMYGEDSQALFALVENLSAYARCSRGRALLDIENYQVSRKLSSIHPSRGETILDGWCQTSVDILDEDFRKKGWVS